MLLADGRLEERDGAYVPVGDLGELAVPETLTALIASRLDGLDPADRALRLGRRRPGAEFTAGRPRGRVGRREADLEPRLRALVRRELLSIAADPRSPERGQYAFVQALIREVAYNTLAQARPQGAPPRRRPATSRRSGPTSSPAPSRATTSRPSANAPRGPEADALAGQARIALQARGPQRPRARLARAGRRLPGAGARR